MPQNKCFLLVIVLLLLQGRCFADADAPVVKHGIIDLRAETFTDDIALNGEWQFYWKQLLGPQDKPAYAGEFIHFPELWNSRHHLPAFGYASYRATILLPKDHGPLAISMPDVYCAYLLFANGKAVAANGKVGTSAADFEPHWEYASFDVPAGTDTLRLDLQIANFVHSKGGITKSLMIGRQYNINLYRERVTAIDLLLTGCLLMGGLFFLGLFLLGRRDRAILLFSLYAMLFSYRTIGTDNYMLHTLLPHFSWYIAVRLEYMTLFAGLGLFGLYSKYLYPHEASRVILNLISTVCFLFTAASICLPPFYFTMLVNPFLLMMAFCLGYVPYLYLQAYRNKRPGSKYALCSILSLMFVFSISLLHYWGIIPQMQLCTFAGYVSFFFLQSLVLSHRVSFVLKRAGEQARQGLVAKEEFLSTMSHEIRTPLNSVIGMSHLLLRNDPRQDQKEQLDIMVFSANNLLNIVNDILDYSKIEAGKVTFEHIVVDIKALAGNVINGMLTIAQDKGITLRLQTDENLKHKVFGDPTRLTQVITNLVHNAIKFTLKGEVLLSIEITGQDESSVTMRISVKDTGIGISTEKQQLIFERFTQADSTTSRSFGGTGLGLSITKRILELQGSALQLTSEEGKGSTFYFVQTFQKSEPVIEVTKTETTVVKDAKTFDGVHILLVDDNPLNLMVAQSFLKRWGATTDTAANGQEALDKLDPGRHQLVLMDLHMPVMDGYEASRNIRAQGLKIPIIALTANLPNEVTAQLNENGINDIVVKPFLPDELYSKVLQHLFR